MKFRFSPWRRKIVKAPDMLFSYEMLTCFVFIFWLTAHPYLDRGKSERSNVRRRSYQVKDQQ